MDIDRPKAGRGWRIAAVVGALYALFVAAQDLDWLASFAGLTEHGDYGVSLEPKPETRARPRSLAPRPGSTFAAAGICVAGDMVRAPRTAVEGPAGGRGRGNGSHVTGGDARCVRRAT